MRGSETKRERARALTFFERDDATSSGSCDPWAHTAHSARPACTPGALSLTSGEGKEGS